MGRHIAFFNIPAVGHVYPTLGLVAELVRRGHRVSYTTVPARAGAVTAAGAEAVPYRSSRPADSDPGICAPARRDYLGESLLAFLREAEETLPQFDAAYRDDLPDLVAFDRMSFAGRVFAAKHALPNVQLWPMMVAGEHWSIATQQPGTLDPSHPALAEYVARLGPFLAAHGGAVEPAAFLDPAPDRHLAFIPRAFQYRGELFDDRYLFVGPCGRPAAPGERWRPPADTGPVLLVSLGTVYNRNPAFYRTCVEAFAGSGWHVVMAVGERFDPAELGRLPRNVEARSVVRQVDVLAHASVLLSHAGMGGVMEAVAAGVPHVAAPQTVEQEVNADRLTELGLGVRLPAADVTARSLRSTVDAVAADARVARQIAAMRRELVDAGGAARAADAVESLMA